VGYDKPQLRRIITDSVALLREVRAAWQTPDLPIVINGAIGPRGDGYSATETMEPNKAETFHGPQVQGFAENGADLITALTMTHVGEAVGTHERRPRPASPP
jgi:homocysteine S-methyltransferase